MSDYNDFNEYQAGVQFGRQSAEEELLALRERLRNAEQVIADANAVGPGWLSTSRANFEKRLTFYCSLDAYTKTYIIPEVTRHALTAPANPTNAP